MKTRHPRRTPSQWARIIEQQAQSGQTIRAFCEQNDIALASFGKWKQRLTRESTGDTNKPVEPAFQPVVIGSSGDNHPASDATRVTLTLGSHITLTIQSNAPALS